MEECTLSRLHQGYTKGTPRENRFITPCVSGTCRMHGRDRKGICVGVYPFFLKHTRENCIFTAEWDRGALLYVYIYKFFKKRVHPALFRPLRRATLWQYVRCSAVKPWCTLSAPLVHPFKATPFWCAFPKAALSSSGRRNAGLRKMPFCPPGEGILSFKGILVLIPCHPCHDLARFLPLPAGVPNITRVRNEWYLYMRFSALDTNLKKSGLTCGFKVYHVICISFFLKKFAFGTFLYYICKKHFSN